MNLNFSPIWPKLQRGNKLWSNKTPHNSKSVQIIISRHQPHYSTSQVKRGMNDAIKIHHSQRFRGHPSILSPQPTPWPRIPTTYRIQKRSNPMVTRPLTSPYPLCTPSRKMRSQEVVAFWTQLTSEVPPPLRGIIRLTWYHLNLIGTQRRSLSIGLTPPSLRRRRPWLGHSKKIT